MKDIVTHIAHVTGYESSKHMEFCEAEDGVKVVEANNVGDVLIDGSSWKRISIEGFAALPRHQLREGDVVFTKDGTLGNCALVSREVLPAVASRHVFRIAPNTKRVDPGYLVAWLSSDAGRVQTEHRQAGAVQGTIITPEVAAFHVLLPSLDVQAGIGRKVRKAQRLCELAKQIRVKAAAEIDRLFGDFAVPESDPPGWISASEISTSRLDSWFHRLSFMDLDYACRNRPGLVRVRSLCQHVTRGADIEAWGQPTFPYYEIGGLNPITGEAVPEIIRCDQAPSRAKYLVGPGDILVSTVRPNLKAIAQVHIEQEQAVASSGFCVLRAKTGAAGAYVRACLVHDIATHQLMRWNSGGIYPAIERAVPLNVWIPDPGSEVVQEMGEVLLRANSYAHEASSLVLEAKKNVDELISGTLDTKALLSRGEEIDRWLKANG
ncbi:hypothetical protein [Cystobacter ferrugineus]|uniref:hypothetical protein n=1 Tax=Cystobacter ferrugineus TaxID=83449 RepID=UPI0011613F9F|nr:hypothetical protein [Cystobacter ferrugineus]